ncbi:MAG: hypothetical protein HUK20_12780 [Fibrobacter sp.]|nr:hypothetical protein [Fibrobacter sp.]
MNKGVLYALSSLVVSSSILLACSDSGSSSSVEAEANYSIPISVNEKARTITFLQSAPTEMCIIENESAEWSTHTVKLSEERPYTIDGNKMKIFLDGVEAYESGDTSNVMSLIGGSNKGPYGIWYQDEANVDSSQYIEITSNKINSFAPLTTQKEESEPVETKIDLRNSYFMFDFYRCVVSKDLCSFGQWHFSKGARVFVGEYERKPEIEILESSDRNVKLTYNDREFIINVEHVQDDSLNNGKSLYSATIQSGDKICSFIYERNDVPKEYCRDENVKYITSFSMKTTEKIVDMALIYAYHNEDEFISCVSEFAEE